MQHFTGESKVWRCVMGGVAVGALAASAAFALLPKRERSGCYVLLVVLEFASKEEHEQWVANWKSLAER